MLKYVILLGVVIVGVYFYRYSKTVDHVAQLNIQRGEEFIAENKLIEGVVTTDSGMQYIVLTKGDGNIHPTASSQVEVHYHGTLLDGSVFDSSV